MIYTHPAAQAPLAGEEGGGEGLSPYISYIYRYVPPKWVGILRHFGMKTGTHFAHFGLESGMVFEGNTGVYERICRFNSKLMSKKEREICEIEMNWKNVFVCAPI